MASKPDFGDRSPGKVDLPMEGKFSDRNTDTAPDSIAKLDRSRIQGEAGPEFGLMCTPENTRGSERRSVPQLRPPVESDRVQGGDRGPAPVGDEMYACLSTDIIPEKQLAGLVLPKAFPSPSGRVCVDTLGTVLYCGELSAGMEPGLGIEVGMTTGINKEMAGLHYKASIDGASASYCRDAAKDLNMLIDSFSSKSNDVSTEATSAPQILNGEMP